MIATFSKMNYFNFSFFYYFGDWTGSKFISWDDVVGKIIVELRDKINWSQADLAKKSGVSRVMIGKYEQGEAVPSIDAAKKIADAFDV